VSPISEQLAAVACDAWFTICEEPARWPSAPEAKRETFRTMARAAIAAARAARGRSAEAVELAVAQSMSAAFVAGADCPDWARRRFAWPALTPVFREVFVRVARAVIAAGRELAAQRRAVAA
jgi:hypothetical protein